MNVKNRTPIQVHTKEFECAGQISCSAVAHDAAKEKNRPQDHPGLDENLSRYMPVNKRYGRGTPKDIDMHNRAD